MKRYIEREPLEWFITDGLNNPIKEDAFGYDAVAILTHIFATPTADVVEVRHSRWEINPDGYYPYCLACRREPQGHVMTDFCPNCGAKMDGGITNERVH
ncbi:MAG: hypothetical protein J5482_02835 [Oscillospiraceae bacterium]|nr:hypothetical protein [Oscillospiraceae bacterium]